MTLYTPNADIPYPEGSDPPNAGAAFQGIALAVDGQGLPVAGALNYVDRDALFTSPVPGQLCVVDKMVQLYNEDYTWVDVAPRYLVVGTTETRTNNTMAPNADLVFALEPNGIYLCEFHLGFSGPTAADAKCRISANQNPASYRHRLQAPTSSGATFIDARNSFTKFNGAHTIEISNNGAGDVAVPTDGSRISYTRLNLWIQNSNVLNTINLKWAQNNTNATPSNLVAGSYVTYQKIG